MAGAFTSTAKTWIRLGWSLLVTAPTCAAGERVIGDVG